MPTKKSWVPKSVDPSALAWLAGLLEGEGSFFVPSTSVTHKRRYPVVRVVMTDRDVIERVSSLFGRAVTTRKEQREDRKDRFSTGVEGAAAAWWMVRLCPYMGERRRVKIAEILGYEPVVDPPIEDWHWLAGLCEGEACFDRPKAGPRVRLNMVDEDVVRRAAGLFGVGVHVQHTPSMRERGWQPQFCLAVQNSSGARALARLSPLMHSRRRARIEEVLSNSD